MRLLDELEAFFTLRAPLAAGDTLLVAYSGGSDSTALLWALLELAAERCFRVAALHLDHATDAGSAGRAAAALRLAERLGVPCALQRIDVAALREPGEGIEAAGRRLRYAALEGERRRLGARYIATAHHRDDQSETVALRLLFGSGIEGLAGILPRRGDVVRPLLSLTRLELERALDELAARSSAPESGIHPLHDPGNDDLAPLRNRLRHSILPHLEREEPGTGQRLAHLGERAARARHRCEIRLAEALEAQRLAGAPSAANGWGATLRRSSFLALPPEVQTLALALLHRLAGAPHPPPAAARGELLRQLDGVHRTACDCGSGWRWESQGDRIALLPPAGEPGATPQFTYTLDVPGEVEIPEIAVRVKVSRDDQTSGLESGGGEGHGTAAGRRVGLTFPAGSRLTVRSRRPGDRLHPLGAPGSRRLKEVLIDRRVPRGERDRIPLLCCDGRIAWVPGVTIDHGFRRSLPGSPFRMDAGTSWIAEITHP